MQKIFLHPHPKKKGINKNGLRGQSQWQEVGPGEKNRDRSSESLWIMQWFNMFQSEFKLTGIKKANSN